MHVYRLPYPVKRNTTVISTDAIAAEICSKGDRRGRNFLPARRHDIATLFLQY